MPDDHHIFLTLPEAVDAVAADFGFYGDQPELFVKVAPLILEKNCRVERQGDARRVLVRTRQGAAFSPVAPDRLGFYLVHALESDDRDASTLAKICSLIFETDVRPVYEDTVPGLRITDQMAGFHCRRCGECCRQLIHTCDTADLALWERLGRQDILARVKTVTAQDGRAVHRIWVDPETGRDEQTCPFLAQIPGEHRYYCLIQEVKPRVCRDYPLTFKHARMTGCKGFGP